MADETLSDLEALLVSTTNCNYEKFSESYDDDERASVLEISLLCNYKDRFENTAVGTASQAENASLSEPPPAQTVTNPGSEDARPSPRIVNLTVGSSSPTVSDRTTECICDA